MRAITAGKTAGAVILGLCVLVASTRANTIYELGSVSPGSPAGPLSVEDGYVSNLISGYNANPAHAPWTISGHTYTINKGTFVPAPVLPAVGFNNGQVDNSSLNNSAITGLTINLSSGGYGYLLVKWGDIDEVYYIKGKTGSVTFYDDVNRNDASHYDLFSSGNNRIPDGGLTLALLGTSLCGLGLFARRRK